MGSEVTAADREKARRIRAQVERCNDLNAPAMATETIASALAAERAKARAPFLRLADEYDANINWREWGIGNRIRRAAEDPT